LFNRAVEAYLASVPAVSMFHMRNGMTEVGVDAAAKFLIFEALFDAWSRFLTGLRTAGWSGARRWQAIRRRRQIMDGGATRDCVSLRFGAP
jgi:hypothetical protein